MGFIVSRYRYWSWSVVEGRQLTNEDKKIVIIQVDGTNADLYQLASGFSNLGRSMGYEFLITNGEINSISKDDLLRCLTKKERSLD